jgi:hypothetical protein
MSPGLGAPPAPIRVVVVVGRASRQPASSPCPVTVVAWCASVLARSEVTVVTCTVVGRLNACPVAALIPPLGAASS